MAFKPVPIGGKGGIHITIDVNDDQMQAAMAKLVTAGRNLDPALRSIGESLLRSTNQRFREQQDPKGNAWTPLKPATLKGKKNKRILTEAGNLRGSINYRVSGNTLRVGSPSIYSAIHQLGGKIVQPARTQVLLRNQEGQGNQFISKKAAGKTSAKIDDKRQKRTSTRITWAQVDERTIIMPARPYLGLSDKDKKDALRTFMRHLRGD